MNIRFLIFTIIAFIIIVVSEYIAYASFHTAGIIKSEKIEILLMTLGIVMPLAFIFSMFYSYKNYIKINSIINSITSVWLALIFFVFLSSLIVFILIMTNHYLETSIPVILISKILIVISVITTIYGVYNANKIHRVEYEIESPKLAKDFSDKKILLVSDIHIGNLRGKNFLKRLVNMINTENPDILFIAGDLIDGSNFPYNSWLAELEKINPNTKIFYVEGNHEKYNKQYDLFKSSIPKNINNISDKKVTINDTDIIGLDFVSENENSKNFIERFYNSGFEKDKPTIVLVHDPRNNKSLISEGVSLAISGHTHGGQIFPFNIIVNYLYKNWAYGLNTINNTIFITSSGIGTSVMPLRIGTHSEFVVIKIK